MSLDLFPCWKECQLHPRLPVFYTRVLFASESERNVDAVLSLIGNEARVTIRVIEGSERPLVVLSKSCDGCSSLRRAMTWAEWVISDFESVGEPRKRSPRKARSPILTQIEGAA